VHLACITRKGKPALENLDGTIIHRKSISKFIYKSSVGSLKFPFYFNFWRSFIIDIFSQEKFEAIHVHDLPLSVIGAEVRTTFNIPFILDLHENWPGLLSISSHTRSVAGRILCSINRWMDYEKEFAGKADAVIAVADEAAERIRGIGVPEEKIVVVSNTVNLRHVPQADLPVKEQDGKKILIYEGGITFHRGIQYVIEALAKLREEKNNIEFLIAGTGPYLQKLRDFASRLNVGNMVVFAGWQPQKIIHELIAKADLALIPHIKSSHTDATIPHKLFHYMYAGVPVLASNCSPLERIINETSAGLVYRFDDVDELAEKIKTALISGISYDPSVAREWVLKKYNWDFDGKRLQSLYGKFTALGTEVHNN
ncbi:MAG: glycosyltransferase family 4 protein, partial [Bacteroidales bacterium]|nr:glycosyltransferase family 4 protein [Bacteroidales bacterium]